MNLSFTIVLFGFIVYPLLVNASFGKDARYLEIYHNVEKPMNDSNQMETILPWSLKGVIFFDPAFLRRSNALATISNNGAASIYIHGLDSKLKTLEILEKVDNLSKEHERLSGPENLKVSTDSVHLAKKIRKQLQDIQPNVSEIRDFVLNIANNTDLSNVLNYDYNKIKSYYDNVLYAIDPIYNYNLRIVSKDIGNILLNKDFNIKQISKDLDESPIINEFHLNSPLCLFASSGFRDKFILKLDENNQLYHINYGVESSNCIKRNAQHRRLSPKSIIDITVPQYGVRPVLDNKLMQQAREAVINQKQNIKADGTPIEDNRTFIQKYWMYIVPFVLIMLFSSPEDPKQPQGKK